MSTTTTVIAFALIFGVGAHIVAGIDTAPLLTGLVR